MLFCTVHLSFSLQSCCPSLGHHNRDAGVGFPSSKALCIRLLLRTNVMPVFWQQFSSWQITFPLSPAIYRTPDHFSCLLSIHPSVSLVGVLFRFLLLPYFPPAHPLSSNFSRKVNVALPAAAESALMLFSRPVLYLLLLSSLPPSLTFRLLASHTEWPPTPPTC